MGLFDRNRITHATGFKIETRTYLARDKSRTRVGTVEDTASSIDIKGNDEILAHIYSHVLVHEFMSTYYALAGWSGNRERDERTKRKRGKRSSVAQQNPYLLQARRKELRSNHL
ncbi:hypothetical protein EVAR_16627_1 [Eumeta japonica]|uniref:Uncharacterized protein n=1 Tax=Eumeta variegata TaxID=151549 RepID=A0A4C1UZC3_EUMVA|nr:hypothetical protein EVAR_16627_1 [Eumeta japonica]